MLRYAVDLHDGKNWKSIAAHLESRTDVQCLHRWQKVLRPGLIKGPWTKEEDEAVKKLVAEFGCKRWSLIASHLEGRLGKQCRERCVCVQPPGNRTECMYSTLTLPLRLPACTCVCALTPGGTTT